MTRKEKAAELHKKGYNCAQATALAFADQVNISEEDLFCVLEGFGLGMGGTQSVCGAISGAVAIMSLKSAVGSSDTTNKGKTYARCRVIPYEFNKKNGAILCRDLKGIDSGLILRSCPDCISDAVEILEKELGLAD